MRFLNGVPPYAWMQVGPSSSPGDRRRWERWRWRTIYMVIAVHKKKRKPSIICALIINGKNTNYSFYFHNYVAYRWIKQQQITKHNTHKIIHRTDSAEQRIQSNISNPLNNVHVNVKWHMKLSVYSVVMLLNVIVRRAWIIMKIVRNRLNGMPRLFWNVMLDRLIRSIRIRRRIMDFKRGRTYLTTSL